MPVHVVAARCGHEPAIFFALTKNGRRKADTSAAESITTCPRAYMCLTLIGQATLQAGLDHAPEFRPLSIETSCETSNGAIRSR